MLGVGKFEVLPLVQASGMEGAEGTKAALRC